MPSQLGLRQLLMVRLRMMTLVDPLRRNPPLLSRPLLPMPMIVLLLPTSIIPLRAMVAVTTMTAAFVPATALVKAESELTIVAVAFPPPVVPCPYPQSAKLGIGGGVRSGWQIICVHHAGTTVLAGIGEGLLIAPQTLMSVVTSTRGP